jgi:glycosyltransferase involved in cell wall biosynthesis
VKRIAYLVNQYPAISHTFVRREILALERRGFSVSRFSVRRSKSQLIDPLDQEEEKRTTLILQPAKCLKALLQQMVTKPGATLRAVRVMWGLKQRAGGGILRHFAYLAEAALLSQRLAVEKISHVHAHFGTNPATVAWLAKELGLSSFSFTVHGPEEFDRPERESIPEKIAAADFVVAISSFGKSQLQRWCEFRAWSKIHVVHCGLDEAFLAAATAPVPDVRQLVCIGRLAEQKGHFVLIQAADILRQRSVACRFVLVGDGDFRAGLEREIRKRDLSEYFQFVGWQTESQVRQWLVDSRAMVLPSFAEGLPMVIMEAMALGRPVISTYVAGIPELLKPGQAGWLVPAGDAVAMADAVESLLATPCAELTLMGAAGQERVKARHNIDTEAAKLAAVLEHMPGGNA